MASSPANEWEKSPAEFDFRSDTLTTPTKSMLESLAHVSLGDDVFKESTTTTKIEQRLATLFGKPAALFVLSGTMGNQISLRSHLTQPPHSILLDAKSHIQKHEAGGVATLSQALTTPVHASNGKYITLEDVKREVILSDDIHFAPTRVICLENTIHGVIVPLEEIHRISEFARQHGIKVHLDGARLWNACSVPDSPSLEEYAAEVDSLSICFSKSLSAPAGSFILGEEKFINHARHVRKAIGGGIRQAGILTAMAEIALDDVFLAGELTKANNFAMEIERTWKELGGEVELPADTNMVWLDLKKRGVDAQVLEEEAKKLGVKLWGNRIVCHFQNSDKAVERLAKALEISCEKADASQKKLDRERESAIR
ncbi:hypothetical protein RUND412_002749 [Rhizina undulata]